MQVTVLCVVVEGLLDKVSSLVEMDKVPHGWDKEHCRRWVVRDRVVGDRDKVAVVE